MKEYIFVLGKTPKLSVFELEQFFASVEMISEEAALVRSDTELDQTFFNRLGGAIKMAEVIHLEPVEYLAALSEKQKGKRLYGASLYPQNSKVLKTWLIGIKKELKKLGISSRFINKDFKNLTAAQIHGEKLLSKGAEFLVFRNAGKDIVACSRAVQDIDAYSRRDFDKPFRDARMGMLPPKLAQVMINVGIGRTVGSVGSLGVGKVYDPFCGSGTILMEAKLMGYDMVGSDISETCVEGTIENLAWLTEAFELADWDADIFVHDASKPLEKEVHVNAIVTEGYLGPPQKSFPDDKTQKAIFDELHALYTPFFDSAAQLLAKNSRLCITFPFFQSKQSVFYPYKKEYEKSGFEIVSPDGLLYSRSDQVVGRELLVYRKT